MRTDFFAALLGTAIVCSTPSQAQFETVFVYQGSLMEAGEPANGEYEFQLRLLDSLDAQIGSTQFTSALISEGIFQIDIDFGAGVFDGSTRYLEVSVRPFMDPGPYATLSPSQLITSTPVAQFALSGNEGPQGPQGEQGEQGIQGNVGPEGMPGADGDDGAQGPEGPQGDAGDTGPAGTTVWSGLTGVPAGFADNIDNNNTYVPGAGLDLIGSTLFVPAGGIKTNMIGGNQVTSSLLAENASSLFKVSGGLVTSTGTRIGINTANPSDMLQIAAPANNAALRVVVDNTTRLRVNANGGVSLGANNTTVSAGNTYVSGSLGIGTSSPTERLHINVSSPTSRGLFLTSGIDRTLFAPALISADDDYQIESARGVTLSSGLNINLDSSSQVFIKAPSEIELDSGNFLELKAGGNTIISAGGTVSVQGATFTGNDATIADDLTVNNDLIVSSVATIGGPESFTFGLNVYGSAGKAGGGLWAVFSDERLKSNIHPMTGSLDTLSAL